jgi:nucleotide-binding universal stress UspA family protein
MEVGPMRVMLAFDGSAGAEAARDLVARLPWPDGTAITLVTALERRADLFGAPDFAVTPQNTQDAEGSLLSDLQQMLRAAAAPLRIGHRQIDTRVIRGRPASALVDEAHALQPDLIVIGNRGHGPFATVLLGSVSTEVVDHAPCPVLVARHSAVHRLVIGADGSESGQRAMDVMSRWPIFRGLPARVVAVCQPAGGWTTSLGTAFYPAWTELRDAHGDERRRQLEEITSRAHGQLAGAGLRPSSEIREGDPAEQLIRAAHEDGADLIVVGSRGLSTLPRLVLGSVARKVLLHADASVLIIREPRERVRAPERVTIASGVASLAF